MINHLNGVRYGKPHLYKRDNIWEVCPVYMPHYYNGLTRYYLFMARNKSAVEFRDKLNEKT